jgi:rhamnogalacturonan endolyase
LGSRRQLLPVLERRHRRRQVHHHQRPPGTYTLHAFADGVLGEFAQTNITVEAGQTLDLGKLEWKPVRYGKQVWEIGYPDRTGGNSSRATATTTGSGAGRALPAAVPERHHLHHRQERLPQGLVLRAGAARESTAWLNPAAKDPANQRFGWMKRPGHPARTCGAPSARAAPPPGPSNSTWTRHRKGQATLRVALAGADGNGGLAVAVNGKSVGTIRPWPPTPSATTPTRASGRNARTVPAFDADCCKPGENQMQLTVPAGDLTSGVV